jgi:hypothetical protein
MDEFFPEGYEIPSSSDFMKFEKGENNFRIMSSPVMGYEYWTKEDKAVRSKTKWETAPADIKIDAKTNKPTAIKHFWAVVAYNYNTKSVQQLEITQKGVMDAIMALAQNPKWGSPKGYDICVTREGDGLKTKYTVMPSPATALTSEQIAEFETKAIDLTTIFDNKSSEGVAF